MPVWHLVYVLTVLRSRPLCLLTERQLKVLRFGHALNGWRKEKPHHHILSSWRKSVQSIVGSLCCGRAEALLSPPRKACVALLILSTLTCSLLFSRILSSSPLFCLTFRIFSPVTRLIFVRISSLLMSALVHSRAWPETRPLASTGSRWNSTFGSGMFSVLIWFLSLTLVFSPAPLLSPSVGVSSHYHLRRGTTWIHRTGALSLC